MEEAFAAEEDVLCALDGLHINGAGGVCHGQVAGVHDDLLAGLEIVFHGMTVDLDEGDAAAGDLLHDETLAAEEAGHAALLEEGQDLSYQYEITDQDGRVWKTEDPYRFDPVFDSEDGEKSYRKKIDKDIVKAYKEALRFIIERVKNYCEARGASYLLAPANASIFDIFFGKMVDMGVLK